MPTTRQLPAFFDMQSTEKGDKLSPDLYLYLDQQFQVLNSSITVYGLNTPSFTASEIATFPSDLPSGTIWYNSTLDKLQFQGASAIQTITSV